MEFTAPVHGGDGRGRTLGTPTLNLDVAHVPRDVREGVYAAAAEVEGHCYAAALHYGARPTFGAVRSCEVHLIDAPDFTTPASVTVRIGSFLRAVRRFDSARALQEQIAEDIAATRQWFSQSSSPTVPPCASPNA